jgi:hypothetical protein
VPWAREELILLTVHIVAGVSKCGDLQVAHLAQEPAFALYAAVATGGAVWLITVGIHWRADLLVYVYLGICSIMGSFTVIACKAVGIAIKLSFSGVNQFLVWETYFFALVCTPCLCRDVELVFVTGWAARGTHSL